mgnify:CR=1 FL=1
MQREDVDRVLARWKTLGWNTAGLIELFWTNARAHSAGKDLRKTLALLPKSSLRDERILSIAAPAYREMVSHNVLGILQLVSDGQKIYKAIPEDAWKKLDSASVESLLKLWKGDEPTANLILEQWMKAKQ